MNHNEQSLKVLLVGESGVGKTSITKRLCQDKFDVLYISTVGVDYTPKQTQVDDKTIRLQLWDSAGQERFKNITSCYFRGAHGIMIVYDMTKQKSFDSVVSWFDDIQEKSLGTTPIIYVVGNKSDLTSDVVVDQKQIEAMSKKLSGAKFFYCSAKDGSNITTIFDQLSREMLIEQEKEKAKYTEPDNCLQRGCRFLKCFSF
ncbi:hypothetical protein EIN_487230 [Entamoeba invadens IP1]|uniref:Uncharacterized protein n=1 Tax=Entamoeba invadens IP1 TaxID=370355 RepID=A0A0A1U4S6_ENTIV|nr:hypothetical protein EIN_487230 [Entamoeba invadens IP1]ELP89241.1 hypothetical protein EIN_487230 [Entamoeba invadens IP1]|eukprot:XP_004256012.1 hypothetical protein EIN_487230 [Entamoeba invadens IP1]